jgi:hypothetical protein
VDLDQGCDCALFGLNFVTAKSSARVTVAVWIKRGIIAQNVRFRDNFQILRVDVPPSAPKSAVPIEAHHA